MTRPPGKLPEKATSEAKEANRSDTKLAANSSDKTEPIAWQAKLAALLLLGWTFFLAWIAFA